jgi:hypothetical protein
MKMELVLNNNRSAMNRFLEKAVLGMLLFMLVLTNQSIAQQDSSKMKINCHCFGVISYDDLKDHNHATGVCYNFGDMGVNYNWPCITDKHNSDCCLRVQQKAVALTAAQLQSIANCYCSAGKPNGYVVEAWSAVGNGDYQRCQEVGTLVNTPAVVQCNCPKGWLSNTDGQDGGVTTDGKCKKIVCQPVNISPLPPDGTPVGNWGFMWGNALYAWGNASNGGNPICKVIHPAVCEINPGTK